MNENVNGIMDSPLLVATSAPVETFQSHEPRPQDPAEGRLLSHLNLVLTMGLARYLVKYSNTSFRQQVQGEPNVSSTTPT